jgi:hypothetical protein
MRFQRRRRRRRRRRRKKERKKENKFLKEINIWTQDKKATHLLNNSLLDCVVLIVQLCQLFARP